MRAHQIMTRNVITAFPAMTLEVAANLMLHHHISGLPVVDESGKLVGVISESDFIRRSEIGTRRRRARWLEFLFGSKPSAHDFVLEHGRLVQDVMTPDPVTAVEESTLQEVVDLMEEHGVKRLPIVNGDTLVGIITRTNLMRATVSMCREVPDPTADDEHIRQRIIRAIEAHSWQPLGLGVFVKDGVVHLHGMIIEGDAREANVVGARNVAGVKEVHDHLILVDTWSGFYTNSPEDIAAAKSDPNREGTSRVMV